MKYYHSSQVFNLSWILSSLFQWRNELWNLPRQLPALLSQQVCLWFWFQCFLLLFINRFLVLEDPSDFQEEEHVLWRYAQFMLLFLFFTPPCFFILPYSKSYSTQHHVKQESHFWSPSSRVLRYQALKVIKGQPETVALSLLSHVMKIIDVNSYGIMQSRKKTLLRRITEKWEIKDEWEKLPRVKGGKPWDSIFLGLLQVMADTEQRPRNFEICWFLVLSWGTEDLHLCEHPFGMRRRWPCSAQVLPS